MALAHSQKRQAYPYLQYETSIIGAIVSRMLGRLAKDYPRLPICIRRDNLYVAQYIIGFPEEKVAIEFTKERIKGHRNNGNAKTADKLAAAGSVKAHFVQIALDDGGTECFAANFAEDEFAVADIKYLYHLRWEIETAFDLLKNRLHIENFTGTKPIIIEQDIYAAVYLSNII
ncbi:transposase [Lachnospiraceae bacterium ZAX-1]